VSGGNLFQHPSCTCSIAFLSMSNARLNGWLSLRQWENSLKHFPPAETQSGEQWGTDSYSILLLAYKMVIFYVDLNSTMYPMNTYI